MLERKSNGQSEQIIILEVKCFSNPQTDLSEFYTALGQYHYIGQQLLQINPGILYTWRCQIKPTPA
jgi:hypothetical protein